MNGEEYIVYGIRNQKSNFQQKSYFNQGKQRKRKIMEKKMMNKKKKIKFKVKKESRIYYN